MAANSLDGDVATGALAAGPPITSDLHWELHRNWNAYRSAKHELRRICS
jgi:hypothetical protein